MSQQLNNDDVKEHCHITYNLTLPTLPVFPLSSFPTQLSRSKGTDSPMMERNPTTCTDKETIV